MEQQHTDKDYTDEFIFLYQLQDSGATNMFGAPSYIKDEFGYNRKESREIFQAWTKSWNPDDYEKAKY